MYIVANCISRKMVFDDENITQQAQKKIRRYKTESFNSLKDVFSSFAEDDIRRYFLNITNNDCLEALIALIPQIKEQASKICAEYIQNNNRLEIIQKTSSDQNRNFSIVFENNKYMVVEKGKFSPLEYAAVYDFLKEPTVEEIIGRQKNIGEYISEKLDVDISGITDLIINNKFDKSEKEFAEYFVNTYSFKVMFTDYVRLQIKTYVFDDQASFFMKDDFFKFYQSGCIKIGIIPENIEYIKDCNENFKNIIYHAIRGINPVKENINFPSKKNAPRYLNRLKTQFNNIRGKEVANSNRCINERLDEIRKILKKVYSYEDYVKKNQLSFDLCAEDILDEISRLESLRYEYQEILINLTDIVKSEKCITDLVWKGLDYVISYTYVNEETKNDIAKLIPDSPEKEYPLAREMDRKFILHYGPTNSGKTHDAIERLKEAESGVYLGPLRLLALEVQDNLMQDGILCSLLTGEEENIVLDAKHMASTVEKLDPTKKYNVCVIDEAQMIEDPERGFAWTRAVLGVQANEIHICMAPEALNVIKSLIELCGDSYKVVEHRRRSNLIVNKPITLNKKNVENGDAYIVFSKKKVLQVAADLVKQGVKVSMIYGNLPYPVRKEQVRRFLNGDTQVVVSTNAIGMGINLPVRRIVFLEDMKFNGKEVAPLTITDVKQIAGRAGRNKETGYVSTTLDSSKFIEDMLQSETPEVKHAYLGFSDVIISIDAPLPDILRVWRTIKTPKMFKRMDIDRYIRLDESIYVNVTKKQKLKMLSIPFDERNTNVLEMWKKYCRAFEAGNEILEKPTVNGTGLQSLEEYCQLLDLYYSFSRNFDYEIDMNWLKSEKTKTSEKINEILVKDAANFQKKCECCGKPMHWSNPYKICKKCHDKMHYREWY